MMKIYRVPLLIANYKLYNSPYNKNIVEVYDILRNYKFKCRLNYIKNLKTLKIEEHDNDMQNITLLDIIDDGFRCDCYDTQNNLISLFSDNYDDILNHELFHSASNNFTTTFISEFFGGINIIEGITEYLAKKSKDNNYNISYIEELLVVEFLVSILGEKKIIQPYLSNNPNLFKKNIKHIKLELTEITNALIRLHQIRQKSFFRKIYLYLEENNKDLLKNKNVSSIDLTLDYFYYQDLINILKRDSNIRETLENIKLEEFRTYKCQTKFFQSLFQFWIVEETEEEMKYLGIIYDDFIKIAEKHNQGILYISEFLDNNLKDNLFLRKKFQNIESKKMLYVLKKIVGSNSKSKKKVKDN